MIAPDLAKFAALLADGTRASFCVSLLDGRAWTAGELARSAGVAPSTATEHINQLIAGGVLAERRQGRHRYVQLADARTAELIETLAAHAPSAPRPTSLRSATIASALASGRTCYDHLAGRLGVQVTAAMVERGLLSTDNGLVVTAMGTRWLTDLGVDLDGLRRARRPFIRECLDWTERLSHVAGGVGAAVCQAFFDAGWITRTGSSRAVRVTATGETALHKQLGIPLPAAELAG
ncbi:DNA-binding transcriptional ArsR family regulator [Kibdelosporangium banguiense]|uniref:DNA-binding transcriptional ArsR family regulator n=1 Tax=Kibdelosporangium banguiense TaxID=1365924 RepID=A0ABS4TST8_9PSEU|nr:winged helix-turn-helix domain-containing protein [Kibdelosporangium banguiense]MBP2327468.1 DNA-binding transcriptional ArsR family regulator [Kibdelosporangium banguiense]